MNMSNESSEEKEINEVAELIAYFEEFAESYPYLMDYDILIIEESTRPIVIMSPEEFYELKRSIVGEVIEAET